MLNSTPVDRISNLPDHVLSHILSFLPTKLAFTTTVLSKRWTPLFEILTTLHFDDEINDKKAFPRIVETLMRSTELIKTFHLKCPTKHRDRFNLWIKTAKKHPLENLELLGTWYDHELITLCPSIFIFPTLVVLKLTRLNVVDNISVDLPSLKTLHLIHIYFKNKDNFYELLNGCPILQDLEAEDVFYTEEQGEEGVRLKTLSKLMRAKIGTYDVPVEAIHNVHFLQLKMLGMPQEPKINSYYRDFVLLQSLIHLELRSFAVHPWDDLVKVLQNCPNLQILSITKCSNFYKSAFYRNWKDPKSVPKCVSSHLRSCTLKFDSFIDEIHFAIYILKNAPLLQVMKITVVQALSSRDALKELKSCPRISSECELSIYFK